MEFLAGKHAPDETPLAIPSLTAFGEGNGEHHRRLAGPSGPGAPSGESASC